MFCISGRGVAFLNEESAWRHVQTAFYPLHLGRICLLYTSGMRSRNRMPSTVRKGHNVLARNHAGPLGIAWTTELPGFRTTT